MSEEQDALELGVEMHHQLADGEVVEIEHETKPERRRQEKTLSLTLSFESEEERRAFAVGRGLPHPPKKDHYEEASCWVVEWPLEDPDRPGLF